MIEFYPQIKWVHVAAVIVSGLLFLLRSILMHTGRQRIALAGPLRYLSWTIDTVLLTAAFMLLSILPGAFFANGWLVVKLILVVVYICLATLALRSPSVVRRRWAFVAAFAVFLYIISIARAHHPLGVFMPWLL
ncbi:SirB2 family protein [Chitinolyticbacter albus]|uniref:SirB2 family protein n=1 Tax=Chitinolyticbacter albus TaxID=2961951 RepID=UPI00210DD554|nr:SirB2 family protein [Chitinolyticbacter albus]